MEATHKKPLDYWFWPWGLVTGIVLFVLVLVVSVFSSTMNKNDLVTKHYYAKGLEYQAKKDMMERSQLPENTVDMKYSARQKTLTFSYPENVDIATLDGTIKFYRPSQARLDKEYKIETNQNRIQVLNVADVHKGYWRVQLSWTIDEQEYYLEKQLVIK